MSALRDAMRALSAELSASLERTSSIGHRLTKGELREEDVRAVFRPYIPRRYELNSGVVANAAGQQSRQQDVIVADGSDVPPLIASGGLKVQPIEAVVATIEIKSDATIEAVRDGVSKAVTVAALLPDSKRGFTRSTGSGVVFGETAAKPFGGLLALRPAAPRETLLRAFVNAHPRDAPLNRCDALAVADQFVVTWASPDGRLMPLASAEASRLACVDAGRDSLLVFYVTLMQALRDYSAPALDLTTYFDAAGIESSVQYYDPR